MSKYMGRSISVATRIRIQREYSEWRKQLLESKRYADYIYTAASRDRLAAFLVVEAMLSDGDYWSLLREVYLDAELVMADQDVWLRLLRSSRAARGNLMKDDEHASLAQLADVITIYRGCGSSEGVPGMSWTLDRDRAIWFAHYSCGSRRRYNFPLFAGTAPRLVTGRLTKNDLLAYFCERQESEIVASPEAVEITAVTTL